MDRGVKWRLQIAVRTDRPRPLTTTSIRLGRPRGAESGGCVMVQGRNPVVAVRFGFLYLVPGGRITC
jgi:hypothetical protein